MVFTRNRGLSRKMRLVPIDSTKNIVQFGPTGVASLAVTVFQLAVGVDPGSILELTNQANVEQNGMMRGIVLGLRCYASDTDTGGIKVVVFLRKNEAANLGAPTLAACNSIGLQSWKNKVFALQSMAPAVNQGLPLGLQSIKIPKRFHRTAKNDVWELIVANNGSLSTQVCGFALYKWYR